MINKIKEEPEDLRDKVDAHLKKYPSSPNRKTLLCMHSFFVSHSSVDDLYARCARTIINERIEDDIKSSELLNQRG